MATYLITGANRGLGLELTKQLAARGETVFAACRTPSKMPEVQGAVTVVELDVADPQSIAAAVTKVGTIDVLINNAGVGLSKELTLGDFTADHFNDLFAVNAVGPILVIQAFAKQINPGGKVLNVTSQLGSITNADGGWPMPYAVSKAAFNMAGKILSQVLQDVIMIQMHPGWVRTDMGGSNADISTEESVTGMLNVLDAADASANGTFVDYKGDTLPW